MKKNIITSILILLAFTVYSQKRLCLDSANVEPITTTSYIAGIKYDINKYENIVSIRLFNNTKDTLYLFSSYLNENYIKSKYLHRLNRKEKIKKISFLPLFPYLSTNLADKIILGDEAIVNSNQILYRFIAIPPNNFFKSNFNITDLHSDIIVKDINLREVNPYSKIKFKKIDIRKCKTVSNYKNKIEFAIYNNVENLCNEDFYHKDPGRFFKKVSNYKVISIDY